MNASAVVEWLTIGVVSLLAALLLGYAVFAPLLGRLNGSRFDAESGPLAAAEAARWKSYKETGEWPDEPAPVKRVERIVAGVRRPLHRLQKRNGEPK